MAKSAARCHIRRSRLEPVSLSILQKNAPVLVVSLRWRGAHLCAHDTYTLLDDARGCSSEWSRQSHWMPSCSKSCKSGTNLLIFKSTELVYITLNASGRRLCLVLPSLCFLMKVPPMVQETRECRACKSECPLLRLNTVLLLLMCINHQM